MSKSVDIDIKGVIAHPRYPTRAVEHIETGQKSQRQTLIGGLGCIHGAIGL